MPGVIALAIWATSFPLLWFDRAHAGKIPDWVYFVVDMPPETARVVLSTIAAAAITTLSLVYSMVLVVFTLAAGTIAPRLLARFTGDRVNQVTAGILGGTFLFALTALFRSGTDSVPVITMATAMLLAGLFVLQLIFFVHSVSRSVTIDEEIAAISGRLEQRIAQLVRDDDDDTQPDDGPVEYPHPISSTVSGYLSAVDEDRLFELACRGGLSIRLEFKPGDFLLYGQTVVRLSVAPDENSYPPVDAIRDCLVILPSRRAVDDVEYSINLLLEIAIRALSPGVNDTFTAIASLDRMTAALSDAVRRGLRSRNLRDKDGRLRIDMPGFSLEDLLNTAFHPLRRAAANNVLMMQHLADALQRLNAIGNERARPHISDHAGLLLQTARSTHLLATDLAFLEQRLSFRNTGE